MTTNVYIKAGLVAFIIAVVAWLGRFGGGAVSGVLLIFGVWAAFTRRRGLVLCCFILYPVLLTLNPIIFPMAEIGSVVNRISTIVVSLVMAICSSRDRGSNLLPLGGIFPFLLLATVSSMQGYFPEISYMKLINFSAFIVGVWIGSRNLQNSPKELNVLRIFLFGMSMFMIGGSLIVLIFYPGAAYFQNLKDAIRSGGISYASEVYQTTFSQSGEALFAGVTNQSQCLGPLLAGLVMWVICDMLFVERRFSKVHSFFVFVGVILMYLTKSRTSLMAFFCGSAILMLYVLNRIQLQSQLKRRIRGLAQIGVALLAVFAAISEIRESSMSKWIRKSTDISGDNRSLVEAVTMSRQGLIEQNWRDFHYNELLGCGFQVAEYHQYLYGGKKGFIFSAPIEKGVLPLMVLGETGVVGLLAFLAFLVAFYAGCSKKKLFVVVVLFTVMVASNFGEADFFSPGGIGGAKWVVCVVGGFVIDTYLLMERERECRMMNVGYWQ